MSIEPILNKLPHDPTFWVAVSFTIFVVLAVVKGRKALLAMLDNNIAAVKKQLADAEQIKKEAQELYNAAEKKLKAATDLADEILQSSKEDGKKLLTDADEKLQKQMVQKEKYLESRIAQDQEKLKNQLIKEISSESIAAARTTIANELRNDQASNKLLNNAVKKLGGLQ